MEDQTPQARKHVSTVRRQTLDSGHSQNLVSRIAASHTEPAHSSLESAPPATTSIAPQKRTRSQSQLDHPVDLQNSTSGIESTGLCVPGAATSPRVTHGSSLDHNNDHSPVRKIPRISPSPAVRADVGNDESDDEARSKAPAEEFDDSDEVDVATHRERKQKRAETASPSLSAVAKETQNTLEDIYGRLTVLGFRRQWQRVKGDVVEEDRNASITLVRRGKPSGLVPLVGPAQIMTRGDAMMKGPGVFVYADAKNRNAPDPRHAYEVPVFRVPLVHSPEHDRFQVGRCSVGNDFVVAGRTFEEWDEIGSENGPVSRFAFRLLCERDSGKVRVFAGGFDLGDQLYIGPTAPQFHTVDKGVDPKLSAVDALVTYGLLLYKPELGFWSEISVLYGNLYEPRRQPGVPGRQLRHAYPPLANVAHFDNVLTDGSIIVNGGTAFIWRTPKSMVEREQRCPPAALDDFVRKLETEVGTCPITLEPMDFRGARVKIGPSMTPAKPNVVGVSPGNAPADTLDCESKSLGEEDGTNAGTTVGNEDAPENAEERERQMVLQVEQLLGLVPQQNRSFAGSSSLPVTPSGPGGGAGNAMAMAGGNEGVRLKPWVFTKCGHVFSEAMRASATGSRNKDELRCPTCRAVGPFRELLIVSVPDISDGLPSHVLHPCGHAVDSGGANFWSRHIEIPRGAYEITGPWGGQVESNECGACPFCGEVVMGQAKLYFP